ncbi:MAG TPA: hypothetical protein PLO41_01260 [Rubrivivax sp.]|nr:hypothetical protein [Rubrivivax sp.]
MRTFHWVSGELTEVQRFINVPMRWCEQYPARERRELWIRSTGGIEVKLVVHTRAMPARRGHRVLAVLHRRQLVGLRNLSTGAQVNFVRSDPPLLWRRCDGVAVTLLVIVGVMAGLMGSLAAGALATLAAVGFPPMWILGRWLLRCGLSADVERAFETAQAQMEGRVQLRRVK